MLAEVTPSSSCYHFAQCTRILKFEAQMATRHKQYSVRLQLNFRVTLHEYLQSTIGITYPYLHLTLQSKYQFLMSCKCLHQDRAVKHESETPT